LTGSAGLLLVAIGLFNTIEASFNDIWGVPRGRNWFLRIVHYWAVITLGPLVALFVMGLPIGSKFQAVQDLVNAAPIVRSVLFSIGPYLVMAGGFMLLYQFVPNTRVHWRAACSGAIVATLLWTANSNLSTLFASRVVNASKIYGSFSAIPILLFGLYLSWTIVLFGAQVAYAQQNRRVIAQQAQAEGVNQRGREFVALRLMTFIGQRFQRGEQPPGANSIAESLGVPSAMINQILQPLARGRLLVETTSPEPGLCPARPLHRITCRDILEALRTDGGRGPATRQEPAREMVRRALEEVNEAERLAGGALSLRSLVDRAGNEEGIRDHPLEGRPARASGPQSPESSA
jgi:membrane protein